MAARIGKIMGLAFLGLLLVACLCLCLPRIGSDPPAPALVLMNKLRNAGLTLHHMMVYHQGNLAPNTSSPDFPGLESSWRVEILPSMDGVAAYRHYNHEEPWNSQHNLEIQSAAEVLRYVGVTSAADDYQTAFVAVLDDQGDWMYKQSDNKNSDWLDNNGDLQSSKIILIETAHSDIHWMEPRDFPARWISLKVGDRSKYSISSRVSDGGTVYFSDGRVQRLSPSTSPEIVKAMLGLSQVEK